MIPISQFIMKTCLTLMKCQVGDKIIIKTYKKDISIEITKGEETHEVKEAGYEHNLYKDVSESELKKLLKQLKEKEFPRSNQVWFKIQKG